MDGIGGYTPEEFFDRTRNVLVISLRNNLRKKVKLALRCKLYKPTDSHPEKEYAFHSKQLLNLRAEGVEEVLQHMIDEILERLDKILAKESGLTFSCIVKLELHTAPYVPLRAEGYLPLRIKEKRLSI